VTFAQTQAGLSVEKLTAKHAKKNRKGRKKNLIPN